MAYSCLTKFHVLKRLPKACCNCSIRLFATARDVDPKADYYKISMFLYIRNNFYQLCIIDAYTGWFFDTV